MVAAKSGAVIVVVLQAKLGEFGRIPGEVRRQTLLIEPQVGLKGGRGGAYEIAAQPRDDPRPDPPQDLRVSTPVVQRLGWKSGTACERRALGGVVASRDQLSLPRCEGESSLAGFRLP